jgi:hypothetical protein
MYRLICADCAEEVWLGDVHPDYGISRKVDVIIPDRLNSGDISPGGNFLTNELGFFLVRHVSHRLTVVNENGLASAGLHGRLDQIDSIEYLEHLADVDSVSKTEIFNRASILPEGFEAILRNVVDKDS